MARLLLAYLLSCSLLRCYAEDPTRPAIGDRIADDVLSAEHTVCHPKSTTLRLSDFDGAANGGSYHTLVIASYYTSCGPGRAEAPKYSQASEDLVAEVPGAKMAFLARCVRDLDTSCV